MLRGDRRPPPGALGPGARQARPLGVFAALQSPSWGRRTGGRGALVLPVPLSSRNVALGQPLHPSTRDVSIPELKPRHQNETFQQKKCRTHELFSRLKVNKIIMMIKKRTRQRPQPSWDIYFSDSSMCPLSKNEWSLKKSFSLNNLFSCELATAAQMDSETA